MAVRLNHFRTPRRQLGAVSQLFLTSDRLEGAAQVFDEMRQPNRTGVQHDMPRLDLRQVENVVDERQQIVAGRANGFREADLFFVQVSLRIVGEQLCQDQGRVQRCAQLMRHVGQEVGLVTARLFQFLGLRLECRRGPAQIVALSFEDLGLFFQLFVGLFEFGLLLFEPGMRLLERPALLFEFLVRHAQFFPLRLQLLALPLGFLQKVL